MIVAGFVGTSRLARRAAVDALAPELRGQIVDVILTPNPASPLCWAVIAIELREADGEYVLWRGTLSRAAGMESARRLRLTSVSGPARRADRWGWSIGASRCRSSAASAAAHARRS